MGAALSIRQLLAVALLVTLVVSCRQSPNNSVGPTSHTRVTTLQLAAAGTAFDTSPLIVRRAWELPTPGHVTGLQHEDQGSLVVMGLIGDPRTAVSPRGAPDRVGILDADTGVLRIVPAVEANTTVAAWVSGAWLITRESMTPSTGCGQNTGDCESWKLYEQPVDLKSAPVLIAASAVPGPIIDEAAPVSDGKNVVWQRLDATGTFSLEEASLDSPGKPRTLTDSGGPAIQLALDGLGNVVVDEPTDASGSNTQLVQVNLSTGASAPLSIRNAHYPSVRSQQMLDVTGTDGSLTVGELRRYPPPPDPAGKPRVVFQTGDLYDLQFLTDTLALAIDSDGVSVVDLVSGTSSRLAVHPIARGRVSGSGNVLEMLVATPRGTEAIIEADPE